MWETVIDRMCPFACSSIDMNISDETQITRQYVVARVEKAWRDALYDSKKTPEAGKSAHGLSR